MNLSWKILLCAFAALALALGACTNAKNTTATRSFHNVTSKFNVLFEAQESFCAGITAIEGSLPPDFTDLLPVCKYDAPGAAQAASAYMDACVEECGKNILKHSIVAKPSRTYSRPGMSDADQAFYNKPEYCKWIDDTYLLMGKANYVARDLDRAESSLQLCVSRFRNEPSKFEAQLWLAKTFWAQENLLEAQEMLDKLQRDLRHPKRLDEDIQKTYAQIAISRRNYQQAIAHLENALPLARKKSDKAWISYILGDLCRMAGRYPEARAHYEAVVKMKPEYNMVFNAKINLAVVFTSGDDTEKIRASLSKLAADKKNDPYRGQIFYAMAELERRNENLNPALANYRLSAQFSTNKIQKAKSYMAAADIYFSRNDYMNAGIFYDSTMLHLPDTYSDYAQISAKARNLSMLIAQIRAAEHQDSLQRVALMSETERKRLIQQIIADVVNKEEAEKLKQQPYYQSRDNSYGVEYTGTDGNPNFSGKWYLYNVTALNYGRSEFLKKWGVRKLEDNWRRSNKSVSVMQDSDVDNAEGTEETDTTISNKQPEYYTRNLPLTDSAMKASIQKEAEAWFAASSIYEERIGDIGKAIETLLRLNESHPDHPLMPQSLYQLSNLYKMIGEQQLSDYNKQLLSSKYPGTGYSRILSDPNYLKNMEARRNEAAGLYDSAACAFKSKQYSQCLEICRKGQRDYPDLDICQNFIYMEARSCGNLGYIDAMRERLELLLEKYPKSSLAEPAALKLQTLKNITDDARE